MADVEITGLNSLVADLSGAGAKVAVGSRGVIQKGALNIKNDARRFVEGLPHAPLYPASITYDTDWVRGGWEARIGPDKNKPQGALGNLIEYGSAKNAPLTHMGPALDREGPRFQKALEALAAKLL